MTDLLSFLVDFLSPLINRVDAMMFAQAVTLGGNSAEEIVGMARQSPDLAAAIERLAAACADPQKRAAWAAHLDEYRDLIEKEAAETAASFIVNKQAAIRVKDRLETMIRFAKLVQLPATEFEQQKGQIEEILSTLETQWQSLERRKTELLSQLDAAVLSVEHTAAMYLKAQQPASKALVN